jgi:hypothetical protein
MPNVSDYYSRRCKGKGASQIGLQSRDTSTMVLGLFSSTVISRGEQFLVLADGIDLSLLHRKPTLVSHSPHQITPLLPCHRLLFAGTLRPKSPVHSLRFAQEVLTNSIACTPATKGPELILIFSIGSLAEAAGTSATIPARRPRKLREFRPAAARSLQVPDSRKSPPPLYERTPSRILLDAATGG